MYIVSIIVCTASLKENENTTTLGTVAGQLSSRPITDDTLLSSRCYQTWFYWYSITYDRGLRLISACGPQWKITASRWAAPQNAIIIVLCNTVLTAVEMDNTSSYYQKYFKLRGHGRGLHKIVSRPACGPRVWDNWPMTCKMHKIMASYHIVCQNLQPLTKHRLRHALFFHYNLPHLKQSFNTIIIIESTDWPPTSVAHKHRQKLILSHNDIYLHADSHTHTVTESNVYQILFLSFLNKSI